MDQQRAVSGSSPESLHRVRKGSGSEERRPRMRKILLTTALTLAATAALAPAIAPALAGEGRGAANGHCRAAAGEVRLPAEAIRNTLQGLGYRVDRLKLDDGCYEARAVNDSGIPIEVRYHPVTGDLVRARLRS